MAEHEDLLHAIFGFSQAAASDLHTAQDAARFGDILHEFIKCLQQQHAGKPSHHGMDAHMEDAAAADSKGNASSGSLTGAASLATSNIWPGLQQAQLAALASAVAIIRASRVHLMPEFGCTLLALGPHGSGELSVSVALPAVPSLRLGQLSLHLVGLDNWEFRLHRWAPGACVFLLGLGS
jgi:hypothetical protein